MLRPGTGRRISARAALASLIALLLLAASAQAQLGDRTLRVGSKGRDVRAAQRALNAVGLRTKVDGVYGPGTASRVKRWERTENRHVDGKLEPSDAQALEDAAHNGSGIDDPTSGNAADGTGGSAYTTSTSGPRATLSPDGRTAIAPDTAPQQVKDAIAAANSITNKPYK